MTDEMNTTEPNEAFLSLTFGEAMSTTEATALLCLTPRHLLNLRRTLRLVPLGMFGGAYVYRKADVHRYKAAHDIVKGL